MIKKISIFIFLFSLLLPFGLRAETEAVSDDNKPENKDVSASVVEHIMNHVADANEYHIITINKKPIVCPLPCILYRTKTGKKTILLSSAFQNEKEIDGYKLNEETGRIVDAETGKRDTFIDFSITKNVFHMMLSFLILAFIFVTMKNAYIKRKNQAPKGIQSFLEPVIVFLIDEIFKPILGDKYEKFLPYLLSVFFFILVNNLLGLIPFFPGGANASGNIAFTFVLAFCSFVLININGTKTYWKHIFAMPDVPLPILIILTPIEVLGIFLTGHDV